MQADANSRQADSVDLYHCSELITQFYDSMFQSVLKELGLPPVGSAHGHLIWALVLNGPQTMSQLARHTHRTKPNVTVAIDKLLAAGIVEKNRSQTDARRFIVTLTEQGKQYAPVFPLLEKRVSEIVFSRVSASDRRDLARIFAKVTGNLMG